MIIGGLQKFSLLDYPGQIAAIIFTQGCNFRCHFCYNPMLVLPSRDGKSIYKNDHPRISEDDLFGFLEGRRGKLGAVVITGGEPSIHPDLPDFIQKIRDLGYKIKLDTNGTNPEMIRGLIDARLIDYIAMDIKADQERYEMATGVKNEIEKIKQSMAIILEGAIDYEFRTTLVPALHPVESIELIGSMIQGARKWHLQNFRPESELVDPEYQEYEPYTSKEMEELKAVALRFVKNCEIR